MRSTEARRARWRAHIFNRCIADEGGPRTNGTVCWIWKLSIGSHGYGATRVPGAPRTASVTTAPRLAFVAWNGELDDLEEPRHTCHNKRCCNPDHLVRGSHHNNAMDSARAGHLAKKLTPENVREIRLMAASGHKQSWIADCFGVCQSYVSRIVRGVAWTHVTDAG
jgi:hypothetical protein